MDSFVKRISLYSRTQETQQSWLVIGNFDGVHKGHRTLINSAMRHARAAGVPLKVLTFEPHPRQFFDTKLTHFRLTNFRLKINFLYDLGVDHVLILPFNQQTAALSASDFMTYVLSGAVGVSVGEDFSFGHNKQGNTDMLRVFASKNGLLVDIQPLTSEEHASRVIRKHLQAGQIRQANEHLGRPWVLCGRVMHGHKKARELGYKTANIALRNQFLPRMGVYAVRVCVNTIWYAGVLNIGVKPTYGGTIVPQAEVHIFNFSDDIYFQLIYIEFHDFLRDEKRFEHKDALKKQIMQDVALARKILDD